MSHRQSNPWQHDVPVPTSRVTAARAGGVANAHDSPGRQKLTQHRMPAVGTAAERDSGRRPSTTADFNAIAPAVQFPKHNILQQLDIAIASIDAVADELRSQAERQAATARSSSRAQPPPTHAPASQLSCATSVLGSLRGSLQAEIAQSTTFAIDLVQCRSLVAELTSACSELRTQLEVAASANRGLQQRVSAVEADAADLAARNAAPAKTATAIAEVNTDSWRPPSDAVTVRIGTLESEVASLRSHLATRENDVAAGQVEVTFWRERVARQERVIASLEGIIHAQNEAMEDMAQARAAALAQAKKDRLKNASDWRLHYSSSGSGSSQHMRPLAHTSSSAGDDHSGDRDDDAEATHEQHGDDFESRNEQPLHFTPTKTPPGLPRPSQASGTSSSSSRSPPNSRPRGDASSGAGAAGHHSAGGSIDPAALLRERSRDAIDRALGLLPLHHDRHRDDDDDAAHEQPDGDDGDVDEDGHGYEERGERDGDEDEDGGVYVDRGGYGDEQPDDGHPHDGGGNDGHQFDEHQLHRQSHAGRRHEHSRDLQHDPYGAGGEDWSYEQVAAQLDDVT